MSRHLRKEFSLIGTLAAALACASGAALAANYPVTPGQRGTAQQVAQAGVPLSELAPNAPDSYTIKRGDTLWAISKIFLKSPWRWPELWGMNLEQIRNPHLIYPGQVLYLDKSDGRARLRLAKPVQTTDRLSPRAREESLDNSAITSVPMHLIGPFLNEAIVFDTNELELAPRVVATQEGRVLLSRGETAYVRGDVSRARTWQMFREPKPLIDPATGEVLGFEARNVGVAELVQSGGISKGADGVDEVIPSTFTVTQLREEAGLGDRLAPLPAHDYEAFSPHPPGSAIKGQVIAIYGDGLNAGQNQIVSINRGAQDGVERGHILGLWRTGQRVVDRTDPARALLKLPESRLGELFVFRVFKRVSYGLILRAGLDVSPGDTVSQP